MASIIEAKAKVESSYKSWPSTLLNPCDKSKDWFRAWVNAEMAVPWRTECSLAYLRGVWNNDTKKLDPVPGIKLRVPKFGSTYACDQLLPVPVIGLLSNSFHTLIKHLENLGYRDEYDMFGAPYDWRSADLPESYFEATKNLIVKGFNNTGKKFVIISHSMGGLVSYKLLDYLGKEFCDNYIEKWVSISAPFIGTGVAVKQLTVGENLGLPIIESFIRDFSQTIESVIALSPNGEKWNNDPIVKIKSNGKVYRAKDMKKLYQKINGVKDKSDYILDNEITKLYKKWNWSVPNGVHMDCVYSNGQSTPYSLEFKNEDLTKDYSVTYSDGDKLVNINSLESCKLFTNSSTLVGKHGHLLILNSDDLWNYIKPKVCGSR